MNESISNLKRLYERIFTVRSTGDPKHPVQGCIDDDAKAEFEAALEDAARLPPPRAESEGQRTCILCGHDEWQFINGMCRAPASAPYQHYACGHKCVFPEPSKGEQELLPCPLIVTENLYGTWDIVVEGQEQYPIPRLTQWTKGGAEETIRTIHEAYARVCSGVTQQSVVESDPESVSGLARQAAEKIWALDENVSSTEYFRNMEAIIAAALAGSRDEGEQKPEDQKLG